MKYRIELLNSETSERFIVTGRIRDVPGFKYYDSASPAEVEQVGEAVAKMHRGMGLADA
ncbi:MAG TPA: hypothetical protein VKK81_05945 [Candidatus Binatia bacterium]|nr:hypothetical protein [Candidatus Binatia bacterium]